MSLITIVFLLLICGIGMWLIYTYVPRPVKEILIIVIAIVILLIILRAFGVVGNIENIRI